MPEIVRPDLLIADGGEVSDHLRLAGFTSIATYRSADGLHIEVRDAPDTAAIEAALVGYTPVAAPGTYVSPLPDRWRTHLIHLRDYRDGTRAGTLTATAAQTQHVLADLIDLLAFVLPRLDTD